MFGFVLAKRPQREVLFKVLVLEVWKFFNHQLFFRMYREIIRVFENSPIICGKNPFYANLFVPRAYLIIDGVFSNRGI